MNDEQEHDSARIANLPRWNRWQYLRNLHLRRYGIAFGSPRPFAPRLLSWLVQRYGFVLRCDVAECKVHPEYVEVPRSYLTQRGWRFSAEQGGSTNGGALRGSTPSPRSVATHPSESGNPQRGGGTVDG